MDRAIDLPKCWNLSEQQDIVIGALVVMAGKYVTAEMLCTWLYSEYIGKSPAPAKLRVLMQRCRALIKEHSQGQAVIEGKRNHGWKITYNHGQVLRKIIDRTP
tara:strand:+ start:1303 stop:1611 length:309 start_codon:yes stop_codon:yes gene_type:complete